MSPNDIKKFSMVPDISRVRSRFKLSHTHDFTCNVGDLIPFLVDEVYPGDNPSVGLSDLTRLMTLINPIFSDIYTDYYLFFVPYRIIWDNFVNFMGESVDNFYDEETTYSVPQVTSPVGGWSVGTLADYMGCAIGVDNLSVSDLFFRAYGKVVNDWFIDENINNPVNVPRNNSTVSGSNGSDYVTDLVKGGMPFIAPKFHDYFTSAYISPQLGDPVTIGIGTQAPLQTGDSYTLDSDIFFGSPSTALTGKSYPLYSFGDGTGSSDYVFTPGPVSAEKNYGVTVTNLYANLEEASSITINDLRYSFAVQRLLEKQMSMGHRYIEILYASFGVKSPDARLQRSEFLGGKRISLDINTIVQTSQSENTALGSTAGYSATHKSFHLSDKTITEHGILLGLCCSRYLHSYSQGMAKMWFRKDKYDFYWPELANIGFQPILNKEIYVQGNSVDDEVFGYTEAWSDLRYKPNRVSGYLRPEVSQSLSSWVLTDNYSELPTLSTDWLKESKSNVDRVIAVSSQNTHQLLHNMLINYKNIRVLPTFSIPKING